MAKAFFWAADEVSGCYWYRMKIVADALRERGHEISVSMEYPDQDPEAEYPVLGQRVCNPGSSQNWAQWCFRGRRTVFDSDDHYFAIEQGNGSYEFFQRSQTRLRLMGNAYSSTYVTAVSPVLAQIWAQYCSNVVHVPNGLPRRYLDQPVKTNKVPVVGWVGTDFTLPDLRLAADALRGVAQSGTAKVHTIGPPRAQMGRAGMLGRGILNSGWVGPNERYLDSIDFDIWVAPYRSTPYNEAKAPTKALEAAFLGIPIVASDIQPYRAFVKPGINGFLAQSPDDWSKYVNLLLNDPDLRSEMSANARLIASEHTIEGLAPLWEKILFEPKERLVP